jgi:hypothetical protein
MQIIKHDELYVKVVCDRDQALDLYDRFSYYVPDYQHMPKYKHGRWDRTDSSIQP